VHTSPTELRSDLRIVLAPKLAKIRQSAHTVKSQLRRALWRSQDGWRRISAGMEIEDLWSQFKAEAEASARPFRQDVDQRKDQQKSWKQPFKIFAAISASILKKLSPPRRIFLLLTVILAVLSVVGFEFLIFTREVELLLAFFGLLVLLVMVLGDHISMQRDIEIAREIQRWLVPRVPPDVPGVDMAFATRPAKTVAGDYYDAFRRATDGPLLVAVADVAGKSVPAAMLMATFQASLRALAGSRGTLSDLVVGLNRQACSNNMNGRRFTTAFLAELDPISGTLNYLCAGHNPPMLRHQDGTIERLKSESIPLGIELNEKYETGRTILGIGDILVIYTDGVTEARDEDGKEFGEDRLLALVAQPPQERAALTLSAVMRKLDEFVGGAPQHDDITCLVVRRT
jgi:sigma-B regulation protein RsbU (phosphoserine phosphatase)